MAATASWSHLAMTRLFSSSLTMSDLMQLHETSSLPRYIQKKKREKKEGRIEFNDGDDDDNDDKDDDDDGDDAERERERERELLLLLLLVVVEWSLVGMIIGNESEKLMKASPKNLQWQQKMRLRKRVVAASETPCHDHSSIHHHSLIRFNSI